MTKQPSKLQDLLSAFSSYGVESLLKNSQVIVALLTDDGNLLDYSHSLKALMGDKVTSNLLDMVSPDCQADILACFQNKMVIEPTQMNFLDHKADGIIWSYRSWCVRLPDARVLFLAEPFEANHSSGKTVEQLAVELQKAKARLEETERSLYARDVELSGVLAQVDEIAHTDPLTYLPNRRYIMSQLQSELHRAERYQTPLSISMLDIDHFKKVNDQYGHAIGDHALLHLADLLRENMREIDFVGRYGGEEFLILLPNTCLAAATEQADRVCKITRASPFLAGDAKTFITVSIGVAQFCPGKEDWQKFLSRADMALYDAKNAGRNRWAVAK